jgi:hypothetical protein
MGKVDEMVKSVCVLIVFYSINKGETQLVVVVVPAHRSDLYSGVKKLCCVELPVASQVVEIKTISNQQKLTVSFLFF